MLPLFLLPAAMKEDKAQSKQTEDEGVFLRFGDDGAAMKANLHRALRVRRKERPRTGKIRQIVESDGSIVRTRLKLAERLVEQAGAAPSRSVVVLISKGAAADPNAKLVIKSPATLVHKEGVNGSGSAGIGAGCEGDGWVGGGSEVGQDIGHVPSIP